MSAITRNEKIGIAICAMKWVPLAAVSLILSFLAYPVVPIALLFASSSTGRLPRLFAWFETPDMLLSGDPNIVNGQFKSVLRLQRKYAKFSPWISRLRWYLQSLSWLWRNRAYGFPCLSWIAVRPKADWKFVALGDMHVGNPHENAWHWGYAFLFVKSPDDTVRGFEWYVVRPWGSRREGLRVRAGWKLQPFFRVAPVDWPPLPQGAAQGMLALHFHPFKKVR